MDKLERLMTLTATLLNTSRALTAEELREKIPGYADADASFRRQFERDKDDLREMGLPLVVEDAPGTDPPVAGYRIDRGAYYLDDPGLTADELGALHLAMSLVQLEGGVGVDGLWNLGGVVGAPAAPDAGDVVLGSEPALVTLFSGVAEHRRAAFRYKDREREVDPYRLDYQRGHWYLTGFDHSRADERVYRVDRIDGLVTLGAPGTFTPPGDTTPGARTPAWQLGEGEPMQARVLVDAGHAPWAVQAAGADAVVAEHPDGSVELELAVVDADAFRGFVLGFLEHAEVLAPPELRADLVAWLGALR